MCAYCGTAAITMMPDAIPCYYDKRQADGRAEREGNGKSDGSITKAIHRTARRLSPL